MCKNAGRPSYSLPSAGTTVTAASLVLTVMLVASFRHPIGTSLDPAETPTGGGGGSTGSSGEKQGKVFSAYFSKLAREKRALIGAGGPPRRGSRGGPVVAAVVEEDLSPDHLFIAVKTTEKYHRQRLDLLMDTWMSRNLRQTYVFTDGEDEKLRKKIGGHLINTNCSSAHNRHALSCKMAQEYDAFIKSGKRWFCHVDDDNYVHVDSLVRVLSRYSHTQDVYIGRPSLERPIEALERLGTAHTKQVRFWFATGGAGFCVSRGLALKMSPWASDNAFMATAERIRLPDDCTVGYIIEAQLGVNLIRSPLFHSHLENLALVSDIHNQVTLSYGTVENNRNTVNIRGPFSLQEDPTRFRSIHCLLYPDTPWCPSLQRL